MYKMLAALVLPIALFVVVTLSSNAYAESDGPLVFATWSLVVVTAVLAGATFLLFWFTKKLAVDADKISKASLDLAAKSAATAARSAATALAVELPLFIIESVRMEKGAGYSLKFGNHGRTPATVVAHWINVIVGELPPVAAYALDARTQLQQDRIVENRHVYEIVGKSDLAEESWGQIATQQQSLWAYGYIEYLDFLRTLRREGFCIAFEPKRTGANVLHDSMAPDGLSWKRCTNSAYTYARPVKEA